MGVDEWWEVFFSCDGYTSVGRYKYEANAEQAVKDYNKLEDGYADGPHYVATFAEDFFED